MSLDIDIQVATVPTVDNANIRPNFEGPQLKSICLRHSTCDPTVSSKDVASFLKRCFPNLKDVYGFYLRGPLWQRVSKRLKSRGWEVSGMSGWPFKHPFLLSFPFVCVMDLPRIPDHPHPRTAAVSVSYLYSPMYSYTRLVANNVTNRKRPTRAVQLTGVEGHPLA